jgi:thermitase
MEHRKPRAAAASIAAAFLVSAMLPLGVATADPGPSPKDAEFYKLQWNLKAIRAHAAFSTDAEADGSTDVLVAVVDTGIDYEHPDLAGRVDMTKSDSLLDGEDRVTSCAGQPGMPYQPTTHPFGTLDESAALPLGEQPWMDFHSHGTAVAGLIASNGLHLAGVTQRTTLFAVKVHGITRQNCLSVYLKGIRYAADQEADVIHLSIPLEFNTNLWPAAKAEANAALDYAHAQGAVLIAAAGNAATNLDDNPAIFRFCEGNHVICVGATGPASAELVEEPEWDRIAAYSNYGTDIDVAGPGGTTAVPVTLTCSTNTKFGGAPQAPCRPPQNKRVWTSTGTSFGAAATSGLAALMVRLIGHDHPVQVENLIEDSADDLGYLGYDPVYYGAGRINVKEAVEAAFEYLATLD